MPSPVSTILGLKFLRQTASSLANCGRWTASDFEVNGLSEEIEEWIFSTEFSRFRIQASREASYKATN
jgi:hypothetical protein